MKCFCYLVDFRPTKLGTIGPAFCNKSIHFNASLLAPIKPELEKLWSDIYRGRNHYDLWKHEWTKHGSCAVVLPGLNSELKYFSQGLIWQHQYNMEKVRTVFEMRIMKKKEKSN